ncbi:MAG: hypothetical protein ABWX66_05480 [Lacisediminihabitans sp.]
MSETLETPVPTNASPGRDAAAVLARVQSLLTFSFAALVLYSVMVASRTGSLGRGTDAGSFSLTLHPSPLIYFAVGLVLCRTIPSVLRRAASETEAARIIRRSTITVGVIVFVSIVVSVLWFALIPTETLAHPGLLHSPFPFGTADFSVEPGDH